MTSTQSLKAEPDILTTISKDWTQDTIIYWVRADKDSSMTEIAISDTVDYENYCYSEILKTHRANELTIKKIIDFNPRTKAKLSETDIYTKNLNSNLEARLYVQYHFVNDIYYTHFLDSAGTQEKIQANRKKAEEMTRTAKDEGLYFCGTAYNEIIWDDIPFLPVPREISKDSARHVIETWTKN